ncbi:MAG: glycosyltransferase family 2 protein [Lachnospiraceae bacterium]|nr:glycosyltransferase family 2 protein [Lachnospiraceae bacterium]
MHEFEKIDNMTVDVLIPTYHPSRSLIVVIKRLLAQSYPVQKIYILHTEAGDSTEILSEIQALAKGKLEIYSVLKSNFDHGGTRHMGARHSQGDVMVFLTQDAMPFDEKLIFELLRPFADTKVAVTYGRQLPDKDCKMIETYTRKFNYPAKSRVKSSLDLKELGIKTYFCSNVCSAYRKQDYVALGGFERETIFNEDMILAAKLIRSGYKVAYASEAKVIHSHNYSYRQQFRRNFDLAVSQAEHPEIFADVSSEKEGFRLVVDTAKYLCAVGKPWLIVSLVIGSGAKYLGYCFGKKYKRLPKSLIKRCTMNVGYWNCIR